MLPALAARWLVTVVFAAAGLAAARPRRRTGTARAAGWDSVVFCAVMCAALIVMTWRSEPAAAAWTQAAVFGCAALWFGLASLAGRGRRPSLPAVLHALMAAAMIWMLTAMPATAGMPSAGPAGGAMASMSRAATPAPVLVISILLAVSCAAASIPWLARALGPGLRLKDAAAAGHAAMSAGMAAMLIVML
jgi:hypothetical protein